MPYVSFFKESRDILLILDKRGRIIDANEAAVKAYGYGLEKFKTLSIFDLREPGTLNQVANQMRQAIEGEVLFETIHRRKDLSSFPVEVSSKKIVYQGEVLILSIIRDISQRKQDELALKQANEELMALIEELTASNEQLMAAEEELRQQYEQLQKNRNELATVNQQLVDIIEFLPDATFIIDREGKVIAWNRAIEQMTGVLKNEIIGKGNFAYSIPFYGEAVPGLMGLINTDRYQGSYQNIQKYGNTLTAEVFAPLLFNGRGAFLQLKTTPLYNNLGQIIGAIESIRDISKQKQVQKNLEDSEARFRSLAENAIDMIYQINLEPEPYFSYINPAAEKITGYTPQEFYDDINVHRNGIHPEDLHLVWGVFKGDFQVKATLRWIHREGHIVWLELFRVPIYNSDGRLVAIQGIARDINERKNIEKRLLYLSQRDHITGLYNRRFFEEEMHRLENCKDQTIGFIMIDLDGLKLVNDTFGHKAGDQVLIAISNILSACFREEGQVARIGGDEFAVLLTDCTREDIEAYCRVIKQSIKEYAINYPDFPFLSISIGYALREQDSKTMSQLFTEADNNMYREKLHRKLSSRSSIVNALMKAIEERDFITEGHSERIKYLIEKTGQRLGLSASNIYDLRLLAQFHDIGKVGIPDRILFKPGPLTSEERREMERHSEIGYRIAQSAPELLPIADWILKHHEWWNGKGYPLGLEGEDIPLECRILAIVDAYDAMNNDRPYRKALPHHVIMEELKRCAGIQFDPKLVDLMLKIINENKEHFE